LACLTIFNSVKQNGVIMKELKNNFKGVKVTDTDVKLIAALQEKIGAETESEVIRKGIAALAREHKVEVPA